MFRAINLAMAAIFLISAVIQYNDPDPIRWVLAYGLGALACLAGHRLSPRLRKISYAVFIAALLVWIALLLPEVIEVIEPADLAQPMNPDRPQIEVGREVGGLLIVLVWMILLALRRPDPARAA